MTPESRNLWAQVLVHYSCTNVLTQRPFLLAERKKQMSDGSSADLFGRSLTPENNTTPSPSPASPRVPAPPRRFYSSITGGDEPYRGHIPTRAERKEYAPATAQPPTAPGAPPPPPPLPPPPAPPRCQQVSVIQRTPKPPPPPPPPESPKVIQEPEQEVPIDYHVPKKRPEEPPKRSEETSKRPEDLLRRITVSVKSLSQLKRGCTTPLALLGSSAHPRAAAAGHSRGGSGGGGGHQGGGSSHHSSGSMSQGSYGGGGGLSGGGGGLFGGGGGMNPGGAGGGRGGRGGGHYGPHSPPTKSLPSFHESLKGGGLGNNSSGVAFGTGFQFMNNVGGGGGSYGMMQLPMDCDTGQGQEGGGLGYVGNGSANSKQYSLLQNVGASYGLITIKDDEDEGILNSASSYSHYEDSMFVDIATGAVVDPLQFTATLTFSSPADQNALLESISDELLQRMPSGIPDNSDLLPEAIENLTSSIPGPIEPAVDPFPEHNALGLAQRSNYNDTSRNFAAPTHFTKNTMFLNSSNNNSDSSGTSNFHNLPKERPELALHISSSGTSQEEPMQQLQVCMMLSHLSPLLGMPSKLSGFVL